MYHVVVLFLMLLEIEPLILRKYNVIELLTNQQIYAQNEIAAEPP